LSTQWQRKPVLGKLDGVKDDAASRPGVDATGAEVIGARECRRLLATEQVGRLGVVLEGRPEIFPVNYTLDGDGILFRTADGSKLEGALHGAVVFEADHLQPESRSGWSVVVHGQAERYTRFDTPALRHEDPSWLPTDRPHLVRLTPTRITGRRLRPRPDRPGSEPDDL
jgi:nitroimidazol reductase NimA-like FMN-containing flavoprotein (pyridoxamine 5'-phosphate oxidase superfamily)